MIPATLEILQKIGIEHVFVKYNGTDFWCSLWRISDELWEVSIPNIIPETDVELWCKYDNLYHTFCASLKQKQSEHMNLYELHIPELDFGLKTRIREVQDLYKTAENRKEKRYTIDLQNAAQFGFAVKQNKIIIEKTAYPCVINNVSYGGSLITTVECEKAPVTAMLLLSFVNPSESVTMTAHVCNVSVKNRFMTLSLQFPNPQPQFLERVRAYESVQKS